MRDAQRLLSIQTGVVKRLYKDLAYSIQESGDERARLSKLKDDGGDEYEIRAQEKVIVDADQMIPDYEKRLNSARDELEQLIAQNKAALEGSTELSAAQAAYAQTKSAIK